MDNDEKGWPPLVKPLPPPPKPPRPRQVVTEQAIERAKQVLREQVPPVDSHDHAIDAIFLINPKFSSLFRLHAIAGALYILREAGLINDR